MGVVEREGEWERATDGVEPAKGSRHKMPNFRGSFLLLALAFHPPGWGLVSDSGTIACLDLLW